MISTDWSGALTDARSDTGFSPTLLQAARLAMLNEAALPDVSPTTAQWFLASMQRLVDFTGDLPVHKVSARCIYDWHRGSLDRIEAVTANSYLRGVKTILQRLLDQGVIQDNPARPVPFAPEPQAKPKAVPDWVYQSMREAVCEENYEVTGKCKLPGRIDEEMDRDRAILDLLWSSGCRLGGLCSIQLPHVEVWKGGGELRAAVRVIEKYSKSRYVYARGDQAESLDRWLSRRPRTDHDVLFVSLYGLTRGNPLQSRSVHQILRKLRGYARIPEGIPTNAHAFRHAFAIRMLDAGHDIAAVSEFLGHTDPSFTAKVYVIRSERELRKKYFGR
jgi:site-specific recombinase XerD